MAVQTIYQYDERAIDGDKFLFVKIDRDESNDAEKQIETIDVFKKHFIDTHIILVLPNNLGRAAEICTLIKRK